MSKLKQNQAKLAKLNRMSSLTSEFLGLLNELRPLLTEERKKELELCLEQPDEEFYFQDAVELSEELTASKYRKFNTELGKTWLAQWQTLEKLKYEFLEATIDGPQIIEELRLEAHYEISDF